MREAPLIEYFAQGAFSPPGPPRAQVQVSARAISESLSVQQQAEPGPVFDYPVDEPSTVYDTPGRGVNGETSN